ncbi:MAG: glycosyltransferase family 39 protein, partial [Acidobacteriaceae bacterium]|nr:glycosyltransferase family 39 protein [Acidobacteriaceae bacterium]
MVSSEKKQISPAEERVLTSSTPPRAALASRLAPYVLLSLSVIGCIALSIVFTTGYDSRTKLIQLALQTILVAPALLWVLRQTADGENSPTRLRVAPFFLLFAVIVVPISWRVRHGVYNGDESAYLFQAKIFRSFHAYAQRPRIEVQGEFAFKHHVMFKDRWFGKYPPGWPALLALLGSVLPYWLISPMLGLLLLWLVYEISRRLYDTRTGTVAVFLMACSPFFLFSCVGFMSHIACAVFVALATFSLLMSIRTHQSGYFVLMFAALAIAFLV